MTHKLNLSHWLLEASQFIGQTSELGRAVRQKYRKFECDTWRDQNHFYYLRRFALPSQIAWVKLLILKGSLKDLREQVAL